MAEPTTKSRSPVEPRIFVTTLWTLVMTAAREGSPEASEALDRLCRIYWKPIKAHIERWVRNHHEAEDLTQAFFAQLLHRNFLKKVNRENGRFRSFLLKSANNFLCDYGDRQGAQKRGGGIAAISLSAEREDGAPLLDPANQKDAEKLFDRCWVEATLEEVFQLLEREFTATRKSEVFKIPLPEAFQILLPCLLKSNEDGYAEVGVKLGKSEGAIKQDVRRMKTDFERLFREAVAQTLSSPDQFDEEVRYLLTVLES